MNLKELFDELLNNYKVLNINNFINSPIVKILTHHIPEKIESSGISGYKIIGSGGKGQPARIPWVAIFNENITTTAQEGIYLVFLIKEDLSGIYLSLNQGFTYFKNKYRTKEGKVRAKESASTIRSILSLTSSDGLFDIDLLSTGNLGKGYECCNIIAKKYTKNMLNNDIILRDIKYYLDLYDKLVKEIGNRNIKEFYDYILLQNDGYVLSEEEEEKAIDKYLEKEIVTSNVEYNKKPKKVILDRNCKEIYPRDPKVAAKVITCADYKCEVDSNHKSFIRKSNGKNYTEAHHLIPMKFQSDFEYSLDVEANIVSLCSNCHKCVHHGSDEERIDLLRKLWTNDRKKSLTDAGLEITFEELLKNCYDIQGI